MILKKVAIGAAASFITARACQTFDGPGFDWVGVHRESVRCGLLGAAAPPTRCQWRGLHAPAGLARPHTGANSRRLTRPLIDELAPFQSINSSARASSAGGTVRPNASAVLRLMTRSALVNCTTGRSAGFSPLRIRPT